MFVEVLQNGHKSNGITKHTSSMIKENNQSKNVLTLEEALEYTGYTRSYFLKLTAARKIPFYKPNGKRMFFNREELENWLQHNRITPESELDEHAKRLCNKSRGVADK